MELTSGPRMSVGVSEGEGVADRAGREAGLRLVSSGEKGREVGWLGEIFFFKNKVLRQLKMVAKQQ